MCTRLSLPVSQKDEHCYKQVVAELCMLSCDNRDLTITTQNKILETFCTSHLITCRSLCRESIHDSLCNLQKVKCVYLQVSSDNTVHCGSHKVSNPTKTFTVSYRATLRDSQKLINSFTCTLFIFSNWIKSTT